MRLATRAIVVAIGAVVLIAGGFNLRRAATTSGHSDAARAAEQGSAERDDGGDDRLLTGSAADRAAEAALAAVPGSTVRGVERETSDDDSPPSAYEVELVRPDRSTVEVDLDASYKVVATDRDDDTNDD
jgi:uncharacterized membrane protein YkoI